jgi:hypothetical protein
MKKPSFTDTLARESAPPVAEAPSPAPAPAPARPKDDRINTTLRISPEGLEALKNVAAAERIRVNDLLLEGAEHVLGLRGRKMQLRK